MGKCITKSKSEQGRAIWAGISKAAAMNSAPEWAKQKAIEAAQASARRIVELARLEDRKK